MSQSPKAFRKSSHHRQDSSQDTDDEWNMASPDYGTVMQSPRSVRVDSPDSERRSSIGPVRTSGGTKEKEKQKRSRVTPEQLVQLETYFAADRSPTATRRKDISENLGMAERQTQIWFQNRRAKAKLQEGKQGLHPPQPAQPDILPIISRTFEAEFQDLIQDEQPITLIPCADLSIGSWRRIASTSNRHDLVVYSSKKTQCLTWFIYSAGYSFKMDLPFSMIVDTEYKLASTNAGIASFTLSRPPVFYMESTLSPDHGPTSGRTWKRCGDWTEDRQATKILRHTFVGSASHISEFLRTLHSTRSAAPVAQRRHSVAGLSPVKVPAPPMSSLVPPIEESADENNDKQLDRIDTVMQHFFDTTGHTSFDSVYQSPSARSAPAILTEPFSPLESQLSDMLQSPTDYFSFYTPMEPPQMIPSYAERFGTHNNPSDQYTGALQTSQSFPSMQAMPTPSYPVGYATTPLLNSPFNPQPSSASSENWHYATYPNSFTDAGH